MKLIRTSLSALAVSLCAAAGLAIQPSIPTTALTKHARTVDIKWKMQNVSTRHDMLRKSLGNKPTTSIGPVGNFYDIDGPDGKLWYCTSELSCSYVPHEAYEEAILEEYTFFIYDENFNFVATIHDKMRYLDDEVRVPGPDNGIGLLPIVTKHYFNDDDLYEVAVSLAVNTTTEGYNRYRTLVYSLGGEKEMTTVMRNGIEVETETDKPVKQIDSIVSDVLNLSENGNERVFMTFEDDMGEMLDIDFDLLIAGDEEEGRKYWQMLSENGLTYSMYGKADAEGNLSKVFEKGVSYQRMQGDQEDSPIMFTVTRGNDIFVVFPYYKETFFNPYYSPFEDMTMRETNALVIEITKIGDGPAEAPAFTTEIPVSKGEGESVLATYYSIGDLLHADDVTFNADGEPTFVITRCNYTTANDETTGFCYYRYDSNGNKTLTLFENAEATAVLSDIEGENPQATFVTYDDDEGYVYNFVDLVTGEKKAVIGFMVNVGQGPEVLGFNNDRAKVGDTYKYAFEMREPYVDDEGNAYMRIAWFNADGTFDRVDMVNMGQRVNYATVRIDGLVLDPEFVCKDTAHEYMVLIKRAIGEDSSEAQEEFMIAQPSLPGENPESKVFLQTGPCEKGVLSNLDIYPGNENGAWRLMVGYVGENGYTVDFYDLPFANNSVQLPATDKFNDKLTFDGGVLQSAGNTIYVYTATGALTAKSVSTFNTDILPRGIYVATANGQSIKICIR